MSTGTFFFFLLPFRAFRFRLCGFGTAIACCGAGCMNTGQCAPNVCPPTKTTQQGHGTMLWTFMAQQVFAALMNKLLP